MLMGVVSDVTFGATELRRQVRIVEKCEREVTERTHDALRRDWFWKEKVRRAGEDPDASADSYKKDNLTVLQKQMLSAACNSFLDLKMF